MAASARMLAMCCFLAFLPYLLLKFKKQFCTGTFSHPFAYMFISQASVSTVFLIPTLCF